MLTRGCKVGTATGNIVENGDTQCGLSGRGQLLCLIMSRKNRSLETKKEKGEPLVLHSQVICHCWSCKRHEQRGERMKEQWITKSDVKQISTKAPGRQQRQLGEKRMVHSVVTE